MTRHVTGKQKQVLAFIRDYIEENDYAPTHEEIQRHFEWASKSVVTKYLNALEKKKKIKVTPRLSRAIKLVA